MAKIKLLAGQKPSCWDCSKGKSMFQLNILQIYYNKKNKVLTLKFIISNGKTKRKQ